MHPHDPNGDLTELHAPKRAGQRCYNGCKEADVCSLRSGLRKTLKEPHTSRRKWCIIPTFKLSVSTVVVITSPISSTKGIHNIFMSRAHEIKHDLDIRIRLQVLVTMRNSGPQWHATTISCGSGSGWNLCKIEEPNRIQIQSEGVWGTVHKRKAYVKDYGIWFVHDSSYGKI